MTRPTDAYVQMEIQLSNGRGVDIYRLHRSWVLSDSLTEFYSVEKISAILTQQRDRTIGPVGGDAVIADPNRRAANSHCSNQGRHCDENDLSAQR